MEGSESEAVFTKLNLRPQLFINEALNRVDELVDGAFDYFHLEAARLLKTDGTERSQDLKLGIDYIRSTIQTALDKRLSMWEQYCLRHCFAVPSGFLLPSENETSDDDPMDQDDLSDGKVEEQLDSVRKKLAEARKECAELKKELRELETKSAMSNQSASAVNEALQLYENSNAHGMFQEMLRLELELRQKMNQLKTKQKDQIGRNRRGRTNDANGGLSNLKLNDLQEFIAEMNI